MPALKLDNLPPRHLHYFSDDSERSGFDLTVERKKQKNKESLAQKYNLCSYGMRMKNSKLKEPEKPLDEHQEKIIQLGSKIFK